MYSYLYKFWVKKHFARRFEKTNLDFGVSKIMVLKLSKSLFFEPTLEIAVPGSAYPVLYMNI